MRILVVVRAEQGKNPCRRKGKGSLAMIVNQGLVDPNLFPNRRIEKGKVVNIPLPLRCSVTKILSLTFVGRKS